MKPHVRTLKRMGACDGEGGAIEWAERYPSGQAAWDGCERADWLAWFVGETIRKAGSKAHRKLAGVVVKCVRPALTFVPKKEKRPKATLDLVARWARGDTSVTVEMLRDAATYAAADTAYASYASYAACRAATYATYAAADTAYASYAAFYAAYACAYACADGHKGRKQAHRRMCKLIRKAYPTPPRYRSTP